MLKKWLVVQWEATPGLKEYDIPEEMITSPLEYVFMECRTGVSGFCMNRSGADVTLHGMTVANNVIQNAVSYPSTYVTKTALNSGTYALSNNILDASAQISYSGLTNAGVVYSNWSNLNAIMTEDKALNRGVSGGWLNIGLYERGTSGNTYLDPVIDDLVARSTSTNSTITNAIYGYGPKYEDQQILAKNKKRIYGIEVVLTTPGDLTFYIFSSNDPATCRVVKQWTLRPRAIGRQLIHLPEEVILQEGQWCGVSGCTEAVGFHKPAIADCSTSGAFNQGYKDTAVFAYGKPVANNWTCKGDDETGVQDLMPYSSAMEARSTIGFNYWSGVKYTGNKDNPFDFTGATFAKDSTSYLNVSLVCRSGERSKLEDLNISITGDSITTYRNVVSMKSDWGGVVNDAGDNAIFYPNAGSGLTASIDNTWWGILIKDTRARLIRNDAWSGSQVGGTDSNTSSTACASQIRTRMLHGTQAPYTPNTTTGLAHPYGQPEVIFCMIGTNDLSGGRAAGSYSNTAVNDMTTILGAFQTMVARHKTVYPGARCVYFMIPRGGTYPYPYTNANGFSIAQMAEGMEYIAKAMGAYFVPLSYFETLNQTETTSRIYWTPTGYSHPRRAGSAWGTTDKLHPSINGHQKIAHALERFVEATF